MEGLRGVSSVLSDDGTSPRILLNKGEVTLESLPIVRARSEHRSFIISTWVKSYEAHARRQGIPREMYSLYEPGIAESRWSDCFVLTDDGGFTITAWVCAEDGKLWHCYVVPELRRLRVATRLIEYACGPGGLKEYARAWPYAAHARTNPYLLRAK